MTLDIGIVGCGKIADAHVEEIQKLSCARVVAVCDLEPVLAEQLALRYAVPHQYTSLDRMLGEQRIDVLHIATPPASHLSIARMASEAGCHLFVEKPLAMNLDESLRLIDCVQRVDRKMTVNQWHRFETPFLKLGELFAKGVLGEPVHIESHCGYDLADKFGSALLADERHWVHRLPGKLFQNVLDHALGGITPFLPAGPLEIVARAYRRRPPTGDPSDELLDELRVMMFAGGVSASLTFSSQARPVNQSMRFYGTKSTVDIDDAFRTLSLAPRQSVPTALGRLLPPFAGSWSSFKQAARNARDFAASDFHYFAGMNRLLAAFYESILQDGPLPISYAEILRVAEIMDEVAAQVYSLVAI